MWRVALRDLQWRRRRFVIAVLATSLVFAAGAPGPFTTSTPIPAAEAGRVTAMPGVARADPLVIVHSTVRRPAVRDVNVIGTRPGGLGTPPLAGGRAVARAGEVVADTELGLAVGASNRSLLGGFAIQAVLLSAAAAVLAVGIATLLAPVFPFTVEIPATALPRLVGTAMLVGLAASVVGLRRAVSVQPALAFGGP
jgi:hypothetical protein